jgi:hypothetical protein
VPDVEDPLCEKHVLATQTCDDSVTRVAFADPIIRECGSPDSVSLSSISLGS